MSFSDRLGITKPKSILQVEAMDTDLRNGLWQACTEFFFHAGDGGYEYDHPFHAIMIKPMLISSSAHQTPFLMDTNRES